MRCLVLLLLAWPAVAAPSVRWIDPLGDVRRRELQKVVAESVTEVKVRTLEGKVLTLPVARILTFIREDDRREDERALLRAREDVAAGLRLDQARPVLDRLAASGSQPWVREYAAAARAVLGARAGEKDGHQRIDRFLEDYAGSRFVSEMHLATAWLSARSGDVTIELAFSRALAKVEELQGPLLLRFGAIVESVRHALVVEPEHAHILKKFANGVLSRKTENVEDMAVYIVADSCRKWIELVHIIHTAKQVTVQGRAPHGALAQVDRLCKRGTFLLPETRSDLHRELGLLRLACGDPAGARAELEKARKLAPDRVRREAAESALQRLE